MRDLKESPFEKYAKRVLDLKLDFKQCYYIIMGDYPDEYSLNTLIDLLKENAISQNTFARLCKIIPLKWED